jgi:hypothetical protein
MKNMMNIRELNISYLSNKLDSETIKNKIVQNIKKKPPIAETKGPYF